MHSKSILNYEKIIEQSLIFLNKSGGSELPPNMKKIRIYSKDPILMKKDTLMLKSGFSEYNYTNLQAIGEGSYANVYWSPLKTPPET